MSLDRTPYDETELGCHCGPATTVAGPPQGTNCGNSWSGHSWWDPTVRNNPLTVPLGWKIATYDPAIVEKVVAAHSWGTDCMIFANGESYYTSLDGERPGTRCESYYTSLGGDEIGGYYAAGCNCRVLLMQSS